MQKRVWIFQDSKEKKRIGEAKAAYYVGWYDQDNTRRCESCGPGARGKKNAERRLRRIQSELDIGVHQPSGKTKWSSFRKEYERKIASTLSPRSQEQIKAALDQFQKICRLGRMDQIKTTTIDGFVAKRRTHRGKNPESKISPATVNKDLRIIKATLRVAHDWDCLPKVPKIRMLREPEKIVRFVTPDHFALIYHDACALAELPNGPRQEYDAEVWWRALVATAYMTGWRIRELLALRTEDVDLSSLQVITRHGDNKGKRDEIVPIHPAVAKHLEPLMGNRKFVFQWPHAERELWDEFARIQQAVGIKLVCREKHKHTPSCHVYGFHDFRRAFATENADRMSPEALQKMMRHKAYATTLGYVNCAKQVKEAVGNLHVPEVFSSNGSDVEAVRKSKSENRNGGKLEGEG